MVHINYVQLEVQEAIAVDASIGTGYLKYFWRCSRYLAVQESVGNWHLEVQEAGCLYLDQGTG